MYEGKGKEELRSRGAEGQKGRKRAEVREKGKSYPSHPIPQPIDSQCTGLHSLCSTYHQAWNKPRHQSSLSLHIAV